MTSKQKLAKLRLECAEITRQIRAIEANPPPPPSPPGHAFRQAIAEGLRQAEAEDAAREHCPN